MQNDGHALPRPHPPALPKEDSSPHCLFLRSHTCLAWIFCHDVSSPTFTTNIRCHTTRWTCRAGTLPYMMRITGGAADSFWQRGRGTNHGQRRPGNVPTAQATKGPNPSQSSRNGNAIQRGRIDHRLVRPTKQPRSRPALEGWGSIAIFATLARCGKDEWIDRNRCQCSRCAAYIRWERRRKPCLLCSIAPVCPSVSQSV